MHKTKKDVINLTADDRKLLSRIQKYAEQVMGDINPQKVPVSAQLEKLRPIMREIAAEQGISLEDMFIRYMDLQSEAACLADAKMKEALAEDMGNDGEHPFLYR